MHVDDVREMMWKNTYKNERERDKRRRRRKISYDKFIDIIFKMKEREKLILNCT